MTRSRSFRQAHRWLAMTFTVTVVIVTASGALGGPEWVSYISLPPLAVLLVTGLYLFALPYRARSRTGAT
ncbi:hypothetical protein [Actinomarinicola tropica]|uniref:Uncharacterized protein n=1 Tax=Actinomarinicola tropica TaxID=2789776 RepID=A0A5Q2RPD3_9ACTN|nr:hypothetical protein [Actinomarinicola tropica]QGG96296.1 hypothetical protein GH723_14985 [Actinomarinicola tropica]